MELTRSAMARSPRPSQLISVLDGRRAGWSRAIGSFVLIAGPWVMTAGSAAAAPCVVFGAWRFVRRIASASAKGRSYLALGMSPVGMVGAWLGHSAGADESLGGAIVVGVMLLLVMLCCVAGAIVLIPKNARSFYGTIGFEVAAVFSVAGVLGIMYSSFWR